MARGSVAAAEVSSLRADARPHRGALATAQQEAYFFLRDRILSGVLAGEVTINPEDVAGELGISRMPVREALRQLDAEGLVSMPPNRRARVTSLSASEVDDIFEIRSSLEIIATGDAVERFSDADLRDLEIRRQWMDGASHSAGEWLMRHDEFHQAICVLSGRPRLAQEVARSRVMLRPYLALFMSVYDVVEMRGCEHDNLMAALASRQRKRACDAMKAHVANPRRGLVAFLKEREAKASQRK